MRNTYSALDTIYCQTPVISSVISHHCCTVCIEECPFNLNMHTQTDIGQDEQLCFFEGILKTLKCVLTS